MKTEEELVDDFIKEQELAVISTATSDNLPQAAVVGIYAGDNFELFFGTYKSSRKYASLKRIREWHWLSDGIKAERFSTRARQGNLQEML